MAEEIRNYKCPCCDASLEFSAAKQTLHCDSCGNDYSVETLNQLAEADGGSTGSSEYNWETYEPREYGTDEEINIADYNCPSCGAQITGDDTIGATVCPYCGNATIIKGQFEGSLKPDYMIPFKVDKKMAMVEFEKACKKAPFLPDEFKNKKKIEEMAGVYVPFWMFDCRCDANITYNAQRVKCWSDSNYDYTKTSYYRLHRSGNMNFENIPVDGSIKADDEYMEAVEPFDYRDVVEFNSAYLSGYLADKYDVDDKQSLPRANERVKKSAEDAFASTCNNYSMVTVNNSNIRTSEGKVRYSLLPVWMLNIKYKGENFKFAINGQTGKTVGNFPICKKKRNTYFAKVFGITAAIVMAGAMLFLNF